MKLADYLKMTGTTYSAFGRMIGTKHSAVHRWTTGKRRPSGPVMVEIIRVTKGAVTPNDFFDLPGDLEQASMPSDEQVAR